jgi:hypothetical protein
MNQSSELKNSNPILQENGNLIIEFDDQGLEYNQKIGAKTNLIGFLKNGNAFNSSRRSSRMESNAEQIPPLIKANFFLGNFFHSFQSKNLGPVHL